MGKKELFSWIYQLLQTIVSRDKLNWEKIQLENVINYRKKTMKFLLKIYVFWNGEICLLKWWNMCFKMKNPTDKKAKQ